MYLFVHSVVLFYSYENKDRETMNYKLIEKKRGEALLDWSGSILNWMNKDEFISYLKRIYV